LRCEKPGEQRARREDGYSADLGELSPVTSAGGIEVMVVTLPEEERAKIRDRQQRQYR
jgi:hypothetical protein